MLQNKVQYTPSLIYALNSLGFNAINFSFSRASPMINNGLKYTLKPYFLKSFFCQFATDVFF